MVPNFSSPFTLCVFDLTCRVESLTPHSRGQFLPGNHMDMMFFAYHLCRYVFLFPEFTIVGASYALFSLFLAIHITPRIWLTHFSQL